MSRDHRLDVWRGLCLIDVVLVHLAFNGLGFPWPLDDAVKHWTRFAAGGFVFLAGLTVAVAFGPAIARSAATRHDAYRRLWRRAAQLVLVELGASVAYRLVDPWRWFPSDPSTSAVEAVLDLLLFRQPGVLGGIMLLYAVLLAAVPLVSEVQRRAGDRAVAVLSLALYALALGSGDRLVWPDGEFHAAFWQPLFVAGLLAPRGLAWLDARGPRGRLVWALAATAAFAAVFVLQHGPTFGLEAPSRLVPLVFDKRPLRPGALLWYLGIVQVLLAWTSIVWERVRDGQAATWLALLGRHSLLFYVAHVFTEIPVMETVWGTWPPVPVRLALTAVDLGVLVALCAAVEGWMPLPALTPARLTRAVTATALAGVMASVLWTVVPDRDLTLTDLEDTVSQDELRIDAEGDPGDTGDDPLEHESVLDETTG